MPFQAVSGIRAMVAFWLCFLQLQPVQMDDTPPDGCLTLATTTTAKASSSATASQAKKRRSRGRRHHQVSDAPPKSSSELHLQGILVWNLHPGRRSHGP